MFTIEAQRYLPNTGPYFGLLFFPGPALLFLSSFRMQAFSRWQAKASGSHLPTQTPQKKTTTTTQNKNFSVLQFL